MPLSRDQIRRLVRMVCDTCPHEIDCRRCLDEVARFVEANLAGLSYCETLRAVEQHLDRCGECREEYEALREALLALGRRDSG